jgi:CheY-like chemotaxis protein
LWIATTEGSGSNPNPGKDQPSALHSQPEKTSTATHVHLLIVEDSDADIFLIEQAIAAAGLPLTIHITKDGEQAVRFFDQIDLDSSLPAPAIVILDINLPKRQGGDVLKHMRRSRRCADALVVIASTSDSKRDREEMQKLGAAAYFRKPSEYEEFMKLGDILKGLLGPSTA